jgi:transcriptional regulator with XRE-family HTH domain
MDLTQWMRTKDVSDQDVADAVGLTRSYITRIRHGQVHPSLGVALDLHKLSDGQVALEMLLPRALRPKPRQKPKGTSRKPAAAKASRSREAA